MHEFFKHPFKIGVRVQVVAADLLDEGVDDGTAPAGFFSSYKCPVFRTQLGRADGSFGVVVIKLNLSIVEAGFKVLPLVEGVAEGLPQFAFGKNSTGFLEVLEEFLKVLVVAAGLFPASLLAFERGEAFCFEPTLDGVNFSHLVEDPGRYSGMVFFGFEKFSPNMGKAGNGDDSKVGEAFDEGAVGSQAIALEVAAEGLFSVGCDEDSVEAGVGPTFVPVKERAVFGVMVNPEVSGGGSAFARLKAGDGCFVDFEVRGLPEVGGDALVEGQQQVGKVVVPIAHVVAGDLDAMAGEESPLLTVEGLVIAEFFGEQQSPEAGGEDAAGKKAGFEGWREGNGVGIVLANVGLALDDFAGKGGGAGVKTNADLFAQEAEVLGVGEDFWIGDGALDGGKAFKRVEEFIGALGFGHLSRRWFLVSIGGFGLFCFFLKEGEEELVVAHLFALGPVYAGEQCGDEGFLGLEFGAKVSHFGGELFDLLVFGVDRISGSKRYADC